MDAVCEVDIGMLMVEEDMVVEDMCWTSKTFLCKVLSIRH